MEFDDSGLKCYSKLDENGIWKSFLISTGEEVKFDGGNNK